MRLDWVNILATVIVISIVVTLILSVASYFAYKVREARRRKTTAELPQLSDAAGGYSASGPK